MVDALAQFNFEWEYQRGVTTQWQTYLAELPLNWTQRQWNPSSMESPWEWCIMPKSVSLAIMEGNQHLEQEAHVTTDCPLVEMHVTYNWAKAKREDQMLSTVLDWLKAEKQTDLKVLLVEHTLNAQRQNWRSPALCGPQGTLGCCCECVSPRCGSSRAWPYLVFVAGMFLVARNDQPGAAVNKILHALLATWRQPI